MGTANMSWRGDDADVKSVLAGVTQLHHHASVVTGRPDPASWLSMPCHQQDPQQDRSNRDPLLVATGSGRTIEDLEVSYGAPDTGRRIS